MNSTVVASWPSGDDVGIDAAVPSVAAVASSSVECTDCVVVDEAGRLLGTTVDTCVVATEDPESGYSSVGAADDPVEVTDGGVDPWAADSVGKPAVMVLDRATLTDELGGVDV